MPDADIVAAVFHATAEAAQEASGWLRGYLQVLERAPVTKKREAADQVVTEHFRSRDRASNPFNAGRIASKTGSPCAASKAG